VREVKCLRPVSELVRTVVDASSPCVVCYAQLSVRRRFALLAVISDSIEDKTEKSGETPRLGKGSADAAEPTYQSYSLADGSHFLRVFSTLDAGATMSANSLIKFIKPYYSCVGICGEISCGKREILGGKKGVAKNFRGS
jgi:hypothetical protein